MNGDTALYLRLSKDDGAGESESIATQRTMLRAYAKAHGFAVYDEYIDDGYSGTSFNRPGFRRMLRDIDMGRVKLVVTKDLSRLGRDYIQTGQYTEVYFPSKGVRYIAVNDGYDSAQPDLDIAPFKNVINELYARDISRKIRSAIQTRMQAGDFVGAHPPYGYRRDPENRHRLQPDPETAPVVRRMFALASSGQTPAAIARHLEGIPTPLDTRNHTPGLHCWTAAGVRKLLRNPVYLGHLAQGKTQKLSFKSKKILEKPEEDWIWVEHTHEPLTNPAQFAQAAQGISQRVCTRTGQFHNELTGLVRCPDCGQYLSAVSTRKKGARANLVCGTYKRRGVAVCSSHAIDYDRLVNVVSRALEMVLAHVDTSQLEQKRSRRRLEELNRRAGELNRLIGSLYEDRARGILSRERMEKLLERYETQSRMVEAQRAAWHIPEPEALRHPAVQEFGRYIASISVEQATWEQGRQIRRQRIRITFRFASPPNLNHVHGVGLQCRWRHGVPDH